MKRITLSLFLCVGAFAALPCLADTLLIERVQAEAGVNLPKRGASMAQVEAQFGAPQQKFAAVGGGSSSTPPITRWKYGQFTVYFENSHVVNAVLNKASELEIGPAPVNN
jgi:hypothetical protein